MPGRRNFRPSSPGSRHRNATLKFPIFRQLSAQIRYSIFGWRDSAVGGGTATRAETFTGLTYDLSSRRF